MTVAAVRDQRFAAVTQVGEGVDVRGRQILPGAPDCTVFPGSNVWNTERCGRLPTATSQATFTSSVAARVDWPIRPWVSQPATLK